MAGGAGGSGAAGTGAAGVAGAAGVTGAAGSGAGAAGTGGGGGVAGGAGRGGTGGAAGGSTGTGGGAGTTGGAGGSGGASGSGGSAGSAAIVIPGAGSCTAPTGANPADAAAAYQKWKTDVVTSDGAGGFLRVKRPNSSSAEVNSSVSEGIAYGMLLAVYADDQPTFDKLWQYAKLWPDANGLMNWYINAAGTMALGTGGATDADEDMAFALVMADARWKGHGSLTTNYIDLAKTQIGLIWAHEVDHTRSDVLMPGDQFADGSVINISYFAPAYYRVFGKVTNATANWMNVVNTSYTVIAATLNATNGNATNGLVPAWSTPAGVPMSPPGQSMPTYHQLDSCRTPFRIGQDWCWNAEQKALAYLKLIDSFYSGVTVAAMVDGYDLNGTPHTTNVTTGGPRAASFVGPAGVGAMATGSTYATLRDQAYASVATLTDLAGSTYYQESWTALSLQMMTGLLRDLTAP
jgi:endo-1,4-beta-D-glucanase Y